MPYFRSQRGLINHCTVDNGRQVLAETTSRHCMGIDFVVYPSSRIQSTWIILDYHQPRHAGAFSCKAVINFNYLTNHQALLASAIIVFVEKLFLQFVTINFHQKALADRLEENRLGLKALDCLSNAHPVLPKKSPYHKRAHKKRGSVGTTGLATLAHQGQQDDDSIHTTKGHQATFANDSKANSVPVLQPKRRRKKVTSVIVNQVRHPP